MKRSSTCGEMMTKSCMAREQRSPLSSLSLTGSNQIKVQIRVDRTHLIVYYGKCVVVMYVLFIIFFSNIKNVFT